MRKLPLIGVSLVSALAGALVAAVALDTARASKVSVFSRAPAPASAPTTAAEQLLDAVPQQRSPMTEGDPQVAALIEKLGDADFAQRLQAEDELAQIGQRALPQLERAAQSHRDEEVRLRCQKVIRLINAGETQEAQEEKEAAPPEQAVPQVPGVDAEAIKQMLGGLAPSKPAGPVPRSIGPGSSRRDVKAWQDDKLSRLPKILEQMMQQQLALAQMEQAQALEQKQGLPDEQADEPAPRRDDRWLDYEDNFGAKFEVRDGGLRVVSIKEESPVANAGLQAGDFITQVNGRQVASHEEAKDVLDNIPPGRALKLDVKRAGSLLTVIVRPR